MEERILQILQEIHPGIDYAGSMDFIEDELLDSFDVIELVSCIEETFKVSIDGLEILPENFQNIEKIAETIKRNGGAE